MAGAKSHMSNMSDMKKVNTALIDWVKRLFGVSKHFIFFKFLQMWVRIFELSVRMRIILKKKWCLFSEDDDSSGVMKAVFLLGWWQVKIKAIIFVVDAYLVY